MTKPSVPPTIETQLLQLQRTVGELAAREALRERIMSLSRAMDRLDRDLYAAQFWPEAEVDYGVFYKGRIDGFLDVVMGFQGAMRDTQ
ncbi:MAG TPA: nuclear transport factor 2 family protein, partial [Steroidobacteraceae bacterium]|nr:nuclear transport factor 2 family protein [Steroidobacteraceae bacterium]